MKFARIGLLWGLALFLGSAPAFAQLTWDSSGNALLNGTFNYRDVIWLTDDIGNNVLQEASAQYGTITFDGAGNYQITASAWNSGQSAIQPFTLTGTYTIAASGFGFITRPDNRGGIVYGSVSHDVFVGSSTDSVINNLFIATKRAATAPTNASFNQNYTVALLNFPTLNMSQARDAWYELRPNGSGTLGVSALTGYIGAERNAASQTISNASYNFANGIGTLNFGGTISGTNLLAGSQEMYMSPDGSFIFGGSRQGWDMFVGIRTPSNVPASVFNNLYFQAGADVDRFPLTTSPPAPAVLSSYFGAFKAVNGTIVGHTRILRAPDTTAYDFTYSDEYLLGSDGSHLDFLGFSFLVSQDGRFRIGFGEDDFLGINVAVAAPTFSGNGVYINPTGVVNAASFSPFTAGLSRGAVVSVFGTGFGDTTVLDSTFPTTLNGVQVLINGRQAPIYFLSPTQISFVIPYGTELPIADIVVIRNGVQSNRVTFFMNRTSPGIFTQTASGIGYAAALHPDFSLITPSNPARPNEIIAVFLTGLGDVSPPVPAGSPAPAAEPLARVVSDIRVEMDRTIATIHFKGLAPTLGGLYQVNVQLPANVGGGDRYLEIGGPGAYNSQVIIPVTTTATQNEPLRSASPAEGRRRGSPPQDAREASDPGARSRKLADR